MPSHKIGQTFSPKSPKLNIILQMTHLDSRGRFRSLPGNNFWAVCSYLSQRDFDELWDHGKFVKIYRDPFHLCALYLAEKVCGSFSHQASRIDFVFDEKGKIGRRFERVFNGLTRPMFIERYPCCGKVYLEDDRKFPPLQAADMNAAWICRKTSPKIQRWTAADVYLERILQVPPYSVTREWLEKLVAFSIEHELEVKTFAESVEKDDDWLDKWRSKVKGGS
jgi:hypothetical protein